jgi:hypothetical protein
MIDVESSAEVARSTAGGPVASRLLESRAAARPGPFVRRRGQVLGT